MRDEKQETIEDIVAEMREFADHRDFDSYGNMNVANLRFFVYRIEAAWKRERSQDKTARKYEYAIQEKCKGDWILAENGFSSLFDVKEYIKVMCSMSPNMEFRIVRRQADWEVVE